VLIFVLLRHCLLDIERAYVTDRRETKASLEAPLIMVGEIIRNLPKLLKDSKVNFGE